jgi:hypothetical protein
MSAGTSEIMASGAAARYGAAVAVLLAVAIGPGLIGESRAASDAEWNKFKGLLSASYFSQSCRQEAEVLDIVHTTDARFLVAAFAQSVAAGTPDARAERRAGSFDARSGSTSCGLPVVALTNLLRLNGIAAELVLVQKASSGSFDLRANVTLDRNIKGSAVRTHFIGPAPYADPASDPCGSICMSEYRPRHNPYIVSVKTEAIHIP